MSRTATRALSSALAAAGLLLVALAAFQVTEVRALSRPADAPIGAAGEAHTPAAYRYRADDFDWDM